MRPRVVFMGTPEFSLPALRAVASDCDVLAVVTRPDRPRGRGRAVAASAVAEAASALGLPTLKPERVNAPDSIARLARLEPELFAVVAYGAILKPELLALPRLGAINLHGSLLPDYRGASPVQRALWDGRTTTGVTTIWMDEGLDTGDMILRRELPIEPTDDAATLAARLAAAGGPLLAESLMLAHGGRAPRQPQDRAAGCYAPKLTKQDGRIDWSQDAEVVWHRQRAVTPWPGATTHFRHRGVQVTRAEPVRTHAAGSPPGTILGAGVQGVDVACAPGALRLLKLRPEGRAEMAASDWARGVRPEVRERFETMGASA